MWRHPDYFFAQSPEHAVVDPENPYVLANHLEAAAFELPLAESDVERFGPLALPIAEVLRDSGRLSEVGGQFFFSGGQNPSARVSLRHMSDNTFSIVLRRAKTAATKQPNGKQPNHEVIANVDAISAPELVYPQAVYLHNGESYFVRELDLDGKVAYVERHEMDYYTQAVLESSVVIKEERKRRPLVSGAASGATDVLPVQMSNSAQHWQDASGTPSPDASRALLAYGDVDVTWQTVAFKKIKFGTRENIGQGPVDIPAQTLSTTALWLSPTDDVRRRMKQAGLRASEGVVGLRNLAVVALPMVAMCDSRDLGGVVDSKNLGKSTMILYDRYPGGLGYCEKGFNNLAEVLAICHAMVRECLCADGCPSCVGLPNLRPAIHSDPDISRGYPMPNKTATLKLVEVLCANNTTADEQPVGQVSVT